MEEPGLKFTPGKPFRGWLRRQGGMMRGWQRRLFVLTDNSLLSYVRLEDERATHVYSLTDYQITEPSTNIEEPDKFTFELTSERSGVESLTLCATSDEERKEWMRALRYHMYAHKGGAIFSFPLGETMKYEHKHGRSLPRIVEACIQHLDTYAMESEGIFRLAGRAGLMKELRGQFEAAQRPTLDSVDVHTVGSLLKAYLREMPESLVPPSLYQRAMNCAIRYSGATSDDARKEELDGLRKLLEQLPNANYATLAYICRFLHRLAANAEKTKMDAHNLALVFGPNFIRHLDDNPQLMMLTADLTQHFAYMLIHHCPDVLPSRPDLESASPRLPNGSPLLRKNAARNINPVSDLLRMSMPVDKSDPSLLTPHQTDLVGLSNVESKSGRDDGFDHDQSPVFPDFVFVSSHFGPSTSSQVASKTEDSVSREATGAARGLETSSPDSPGFEHKPIPPRRKAKTLKNWRHPMRHGGMLPQGSKDDTAIQHTSISRTTNVSTAQHEKSEVENVDTELPNSQFYVETDTHSGRDKNGDSSRNTPSEFKAALSTGAVKTPVHRVGNKAGPTPDTSKLEPSRALLEAQVTMLKAELRNIKSQSERNLSALKNQLIAIQSKYEARISSMGRLHSKQIRDLKAELEAERTARSEAVERTVSLKTELCRYEQHYGKLQD